MKKIIYIFKIIKEGKENTGKNGLIIFLDILSCSIKYKASLKDYDTIEMYKMNNFERKTMITKGKNKEYIKKYNHPKYMKLLNNQIIFNKIFKKYLNREWIELNRNKNEFKKFLNHKNEIVAKTEFVKNQKTEHIFITNQNIDELYNKLEEEGKYLIEEVIEECQTLKKIFPKSISIVKIITLLGSPTQAFLQIKSNKKTLIAPINIETGSIEYQATDDEKNTYEKHPITGVKIVGITIPNWKKVIELCENASLEIPAVGYVEWSICIGTSFCYLINAKGEPNHTLYQLPPHRNSNIGMIPIFKRIEERKIEK